MQASLSVVRRRPRDRSRLEGLAGRLAVTIRSCSAKLGDPLDSYLHVGTEALRLSVDRSLLAQAARARTRRELEALVGKIKGTISLEHRQFSATRLGPVVPGSSVKGNVRSRLELSFVPREGRVRSCLIRATYPEEEPEWRHYRIWRASLQQYRGQPCSCTEGWEVCEVCLLCDLFGTTGLQGLVSFSDFVGEGVSLQRLSLPIGESLEAAPPGSRFKGSVTFRNLEPVELGLLLYGMGLRNSRVGRPVLLGKLKYRRDLPHVFGVVRYELEELALAPFSQPLNIGRAEVKPGAGVSGDQLDLTVLELVSLASSEFSGELLDVDEVAEVERLKA
ncbi:MAG: RAMP superfamily CRISPR-associated protein [Infirmifilum sp.]